MMTWAKMLKPLALVLVLLVYLPSRVALSSCGLRTLSTSSYGYLSSPIKVGGGGFTPSNPISLNTEYPNNMDCVYDIKAPLGTIVKLSWKRFDLKGYMPTCWPDDFVEIFVGCSKKTIGKYCSINSQRPFDVYSPDNCMRIKFHSNSKEVAKGFLAYYSTLPKSNSYLPNSCGNFLKSGSYGTISSSRWPNNYIATGASCYWAIQVGKSKNIKIVFMDFNLPYDFGCDDVKVKIKADDDDKSYSRADKTELDSKCGDKSPFSVTSSEERVYIRFKTGIRNTRYRGFVAGYVLYEPSIHDTGSKVAIIVVCIVIVIVIIGCVVFCYIRRRRAAQRYHHPPAAVPMAAASYPTQQPVSVPPPSYGQATGGPYPPPGSQPPPAKTPYPPPGGQPYPPSGQTPYPPPGGQPYPPPGGQPYPPPGGQPYPPPGGQPYPPPGGQPYPPPGTAPYPATDAPPYPAAGAPPYPPGQGQPYPPPGQEKTPYPPM